MSLSKTKDASGVQFFAQAKNRCRLAAREVVPSGQLRQRKKMALSMRYREAASSLRAIDIFKGARLSSVEADCIYTVSVLWLTVCLNCGYAVVALVLYHSQDIFF